MDALVKMKNTGKLSLDFKLNKGSNSLNFSVVYDFDDVGKQRDLLCVHVGLIWQNNSRNNTQQ